MNMKRSKLILGGIGAVAILTATFLVSNNLNKDVDKQYTQDRGSLATQAGANGFREWVKGTMIDVETGAPIESEKLNLIVRNYKKSQNKALTVNWKEHGPDNIGGRTRAILVDHTNENIIWSGGVSGGLYKSLNGANTWSRIENFPGG